MRLSHGFLLKIYKVCLSNCQGWTNCISFCTWYLNDYIHILSKIAYLPAYIINTQRHLVSNCDTEGCTTKSSPSIVNHVKATFSLHKITTKTLKCLTYILISHFTWLLQWFIILDMNNLEKVSHHYWMLLKLSIKL